MLPEVITRKVLTMRSRLKPVDAVAQARVERDRQRTRELAGFMRILSDHQIPADHPELMKLAQDCIEELNDLNDQWRDEVRWRL